MARRPARKKSTRKTKPKKAAKTRKSKARTPKKKRKTTRSKAKSSKKTTRSKSKSSKTRRMSRAAIAAREPEDGKARPGFDLGGVSPEDREGVHTIIPGGPR